MTKLLNYSLHISLLLLFIEFSSVARAQCCSAGNPVGGDAVNNNLQKNEWLTNILYRYSISDQYYNNDHQVQVPIIENSYYNFLNLKLAYGLSNRISIHSQLGYFINKVQSISINDKDEAIGAGGPGDILVALKYKLFSKPYQSLSVSGGLKLPVGAFNETQDGVYIPISLQPSSGAMKYNVSLQYLNTFSKVKSGFIAFGSFELSNTINKDFLEYKYGPLLSLSSGYFYSFNKFTTLSTLIKYEHRGHDKRENQVVIKSTGSHLLLLNPVLSIGNQDWKLVLQADIPLYKYVNGYQLTNKYALQIGIRKKISPCK